MDWTQAKAGLEFDREIATRLGITMSQPIPGGGVAPADADVFPTGRPGRGRHYKVEGGTFPFYDNGVLFMNREGPGVTWRPTTQVDTAFSFVVAEITKLGFRLGIFSPPPDANHWLVSFQVPYDTGKRDLVCIADTVSLAICRAAMAVWESLEGSDGGDKPVSLATDHHLICEILGDSRD